MAVQGKEMLVVILFIAAFMSLPTGNLTVPGTTWFGPASKRVQGRIPRACFTNQKMIAGALEMYNLDYNVNVDQLTPALHRRLVDEGYLHSCTTDTGCQGGADGISYLILPEHGMICLRHGFIHPPGEVFASPRQQLIDAGVTDCALLSRASRDPLYEEPKPHRWVSLMLFSICVMVPVCLFGLGVYLLGLGVLAIGEANPGMKKAAVAVFCVVMVVAGDPLLFLFIAVAIWFYFTLLDALAESPEEEMTAPSSVH